MQDTLVKWLVWIVGSLFIGGGVLVLLLALFRDRSRGRKRCPKCWYDMTHAPPPGLQCSECGREYAKESVLYRTRRRWRFAALGVLMVFIGYAGFIARKAFMDGWPSAVPSSALVMFWPISEKDWLDLDFAATPTTDGAFWELHDRMENGQLWDWQERWWAHRLAKYAKAHRRFGVDRERATLEKLTRVTIPLDRPIESMDELARRIFEAAQVPVSAPSFTFTPPIVARSQPPTALGVITSALDQVHRWNEQVADSATYPYPLWDLDANQLRLNSDPDDVSLRTVYLVDAAAALSLVEKRWRSLNAREEPFDRVHAREQLRDACQMFVAPESWIMTGGSSSLTSVGDHLLVQASPRTALAIDSLLAKMSTPIDPMNAGDRNAGDAAMHRHLQALEKAPFRLPESVQVVDDLVHAVESQSRITVRQNYAYVSPVVLDQHARERLTLAEATCADALDEAVRCVTDSKVFAAHWSPTSDGAVVVPEASFLAVEIRVYDVTGLLPRPAQAGLAASPSDAMSDLQRLIATTVDPDNWIDNGGELNRSMPVGTLLVVAAPVRTQIAVERMLAQIDANATRE